MSTIDISSLRVNGGTQSRAEINRDVVSDYAELVSAGVAFPPVVVFFDGSEYWLADGFHRYEAYAKAGVYEIPADIRQGGQRDAILFSVGANAAHGLRRTRDDKRRAVLTLLNDPEWSKWSDREIARQCGVNHETVGGYRKKAATVTGENASERTYTTKHGTTAAMNTANIGGGSKPDQKSPPASAPAQPVVTQTDPDAGEPDSAAPAAVPSDADQNEISTDEERARHELAKLTDDALIDEIIGLRADLIDLRKEAETIRRERDDLRSWWAAANEGSDVGSALGTAKKQINTLRGRMNEYQAEASRLGRRVAALEKEKAELQRQLENQIIEMA